MATVFVNYRVREQGGYATLLHRELSRVFGSSQVFLSSFSIPPGDDFAAEIFRAVRGCEILLAVIGPRWSKFHRDPESDWVHREIAEAFTCGVRVVPVLVEDADLPTEAELPGGIATLARCQYVRLRHRSIESDLDQLVREIRKVAPALDPHRAVEPFTKASSLYQLTGEHESPCRIGVLPGTIRRVRAVDIWVNSENTEMRMARHTEFNVSAIIRYFGAVRDETGAVVEDLVADELDAKVASRRPVAPGTVITTTAGMLATTHNVRYIMHVAAVHGEPGAGFRQVHDIGWCVSNVLVQAEGLAGSTDSNSILFPLLGTGVAGASVTATTRSMVLAALDHLAQHPETRLRRIYFLAYNQHEKSTLDEVLRGLPIAEIKPPVQPREQSGPLRLRP
ncbi:TIR domain-containing protein [Actinophytocola sp.]|uniref:TIR domain-containing protein n=1 Tax=Actinophytocola sp. TaxID=1872138 RepID=UPI002D47B6BA|nr:TIR domain-containing protein [Actinophytocola sp.]HYQ63654.1 TIR domain-containing protein [Actinophytocola sp.]